MKHLAGIYAENVRVVIKLFIAIHAPIAPRERLDPDFRCRAGYCFIRVAPSWKTAQLFLGLPWPSNMPSV